MLEELKQDIEEDQWSPLHHTQLNRDLLAFELPLVLEYYFLFFPFIFPVLLN